MLLARWHYFKQTLQSNGAPAQRREERSRGRVWERRGHWPEQCEAWGGGVNNDKDNIPQMNPDFQSSQIFFHLLSY